VIVAQDLVSAQVGDPAVTKVTIDDDNPLALSQLSAYNAARLRPKLTHVRVFQVSTKPLRWFAPAALVGLICIGVVPSAAAEGKKSTTARTTVKRTTTRPKRPLYSAQRSLTRRAT